jgi:hypothetical protein
LLCVLTHRRLKRGSYEAFRDAWQPDDCSLDDPDEVISFAFYDATADEFEAIRDDPSWLAAEDRRLQRIAPFQLAMRIGGVYEVAERITAS